MVVPVALPSTASVTLTSLEAVFSKAALVVYGASRAYLTSAGSADAISLPGSCDSLQVFSEISTPSMPTYNPARRLNPIHCTSPSQGSIFPGLALAWSQESLCLHLGLATYIYI